MPHDYSNMDPDKLTTWDDVGFILNGRRVMVWFQHTRCKYRDVIEDMAYEQVDSTSVDSLGDDRFGRVRESVKVYRPLGKMGKRKKVVAYSSHGELLPEVEDYYLRLDAAEERMCTEGIDLDVTPSFGRTRLWWATGITLIAPLEVHSVNDIKTVAELARKVLLGQTTMEQEFPGYRYGRQDWIREQASLQCQIINANVNAEDDDWANASDEILSDVKEWVA